MSREFLSDFIQIYENNPCLWQVSSKDYHDRTKKEAGYARLLEKLKEVDTNATKDAVIKKINNIRSAFRKENKKIKDSIKSGASADSVYKPRLWYFSMLSFLADQDTPRTSRSNLGSDDDGADGENTSEPDVPNVYDIVELDGSTKNCEGILSQSLASTNTSVPPTQTRKKCDKQDRTGGLAKEVLVQVNDYFKKPRTEEDRFDVIGKGFAIKLRGLPQQQMLIAEKLMNDVLFQAEMGSLTISHRLTSEQHPNHAPRYYHPVSYQGSPTSSHTSLSYPSPSPSPNQQPELSPQTLRRHNQDFHSNVQYGYVPQGDNKTAASYLSNFVENV